MGLGEEVGAGRPVPWSLLVWCERALTGSIAYSVLSRSTPRLTLTSFFIHAIIVTISEELLSAWG